MSISSIDTGSEVLLIDNFLSTEGNTLWLSSDGGTGTRTLGFATGHMGHSGFRSGGTALSRSCLKKGNSSILFSPGDNYYIRQNVQINTLATAAQDYVVVLGFMNDEVADPTQGAYFEYNRAVNGDFWTCITNSGGSKTTTITSNATIASQFYNLNISVRGNGIIDFYINDIVVASHTTNIPSVSCGIMLVMRKTAGTTNITSFAIDQFLFYAKLNTNRFL